MPEILFLTTQTRSLEDTITLVVGPGDKERRLVVHKDVLCGASPFFEAACKPEWMNPNDKVLKLPDDDPETIQAMVYWMYYNTICVLEAISYRNFDFETTAEEAMGTIWGLFAKLYVCGDKYQMPRLQNDAADAMTEYSDNCKFNCPAIIPWVYEHTSSDSRLRRLLVTIVRLFFCGDEIASCKKLLCPEFLFDLTFSFFKDKDKEYDGEQFNVYLALPSKEFCKLYHVHPTGVSPCKQQKYYDIYEPDYD
jgi:hypothetical protein